MRRNDDLAQRGERDPLTEDLSRPGGGGSCVSTNEKWQIIVLGSPTSGTFDLGVTVNGTKETLTFNYDDTAAEIATEFKTHSEIGASDVTVTDGPLPDTSVTIEFTGDLAGTAMTVPPEIDFGSLTGTSGVLVVRWQQGG